MIPFSGRLPVVENLESLASRFFATVGIVEPAGYHAIEVLLDERAQTSFGGRERLRLAFSPEAAHEHSDAELVTYGSSFLDTVTELATARGNTVHMYLNGLNPTVGRTLEKVRGQVRIPGHLLEVGEEQLLLFHHALFDYKVSLIGEEREEFFQNVMVDLHTGWTSSRIDEQSLRLCVSGQPGATREMNLLLSMVQSYHAAQEKLREDLVPQIKLHEEELKIACQVEQKQVSEHYQTMIARIEDGKIHKGSDPEHLNARIRAIHADQELRLQDLEKRYRLVIEITLTQLALVSYLKAAVPLRLQQGKEIRSGMAIWDSFTRQGYVTEI